MSILALKICAPGYRSHYDPRVQYPHTPGSVIKLNRQLFRARYPKLAGYGLHCFGGDWARADRLPDCLWRTAGDALDHCLVLELLPGDWRLVWEYRCRERAEPWGVVMVSHLVTWRAVVRGAGKWGSDL